jgi:molybdenum cofactor biosynthesis protein B
MGYREHRSQTRATAVGCAVLTVSSSRTEYNDDSGRIIREKLLQSRHRVLFYEVVEDDSRVISTTLRGWLKNPEVQVIVTSGGTGISRKDVTIEAIVPLLEKEFTGFGELFRWLSYQEIGSASMISRAAAGVVRGRVLFCLPGSPSACDLAMDKLIIPELAHLVWEANR